VQENAEYAVLEIVTDSHSSIYLLVSVFFSSGACSYWYVCNVSGGSVCVCMCVYVYVCV
jgi:hypothetical protein